MILPEPLVDVMVTYMKNVRSGPYGDTVTLTEVTKRGFYSALFNNFAVPPRYAMFNGILLPDGFGGDHISVDKIISWTPIF